MKSEYYCGHQGKKCQLSLIIQKAIRDGKIIANGEVVCDFYVPVTPDEVEHLEKNDRDITCVGPDDPNCPDPRNVKVLT